MDDTGSTAFSLQSVGRSALLLAVATVVGQVAALGRELFVAANTGTSRELDALLVALVIPTLVAEVGSSGVQAATVTAYASVARDGGHRAAQRFAGGVLSWIIIGASALLVVTILVDNWAITVAGPGMAAADQELARGFLPSLLPIMVLLPIATVLAAVCQAQQRFSSIAASTLAGSLTSTVATVVLWPSLGVSALAVALVINAAVALGMLALGLWRAGSLPIPNIRIERRYAVPFVRHLVPLSAGTALSPFNLLADRAVASFLSAGGVSALRYGQQLVHAPVNALSGAWGTVILPALVRTTHEGTEGSTGEAAARAVRYIGATFIPVAAAVAALAPLLVHLLYQRGAFDADAAARTSGVVAGLAPLLPLSMALSVMTGTHNARRRGAIIGASAVLGAVLNLVFNILFARQIGVAGIALSTSSTSLLILILLGWRLHRLEPGFDGTSVARSWIKAGIASGAAAAPVALIVWTDAEAGLAVPALAWLVLLPMLGAAIYLAAAAVLRYREPGDVVTALVGIARQRLGRS